MSTELINKELKVAWLFPNILFLHGERGNIQALKKTAGFAGVDISVDKIYYDTENFEPNDYDIIFCPPGEIASFETVIGWLKPYKESFQKFVDTGKILLATGTSQCIFGKKTKREDGDVLEGLGILDCTFEERKYVYGDDIHFTTTYSGEEKECFGVQTQMIDVYSNEQPFGHLLYGFGNTGKDRCEGSIVNNSIFTNVLGPLLVLNPWITKSIICKALENRGVALVSFEMNVELEEKSLETKKNFISNKKTRLTNCL